MANHTGRLGKLSFIKEAAWGTYLDPDKALSITAESLENKLSFVEDGRFIGEIMQSDMILVGEEVEGNIELTAHPKEIGPMIFFALMKTDAPSTSPEAVLLISYVGTDAYSSIINAAGVMEGKSGATAGTAVQAWQFDTTAAGYDTATELQAAIDAVSGWNAFLIGAAATACSKIANFTETQMHGMFIVRFASSSTTTKEHKIYPAGASDTEPSMSICADRTIGTGKAIGLSGCKVNTLSLTCESRQIVKLSIGLSGKVEATGKTYPTITLTTDKPYVSANVTMYLNGVQVESFKNISLQVSNNLSKDGRIGSNYIQEQTRQGVQAIFSGVMNLIASEWETYYPIVKADTTMEVFIVIQHGEYADTTNAVKYLTMIRIPAVKFTKWPVLLSGPNKLTVDTNGNAVNSSYYENVEAHVVDLATAAY